MPGQLLVVTSQKIASWETAGKTNCSNVYCGIPPNQWVYSPHLGIFWHTADFVSVYTEHTTFYYLAKSVCTASIECCFENIHFFGDTLVMFVHLMSLKMHAQLHNRSTKTTGWVVILHLPFFSPSKQNDQTHVVMNKKYPLK